MALNLRIMNMILNFFREHKTILILLAILILASFFRLWQIDSIPPGLYPDEAINANQAISEPGKIFYPENNGREGFFINLIGLSFSALGVSIWSLKIIPALIGIFTVLGLYLFTKELFQISYYKERVSRNIALFASFFLATSFWHINFSRIDFRAILVPLILVFSFYFLFRGFRAKKFWYFIIAGAIFGLGFHTYIAFRLAILVAGAALIFWWIIYRRQKLQKKFFGFAALFLIFVFIAALPIGIYFLQNPGDFMGRAGGVSIFAQQNLIISAGKSLVTHLAMFNFIGDYNWRHNISGWPILFWPVGILFLIGFALSIQRKKLFSTPTGFLIIWWLAMLIPGVLSYEGIPHSLRVIGAIPPTFIFAGMGAEFLRKKIKEKITIKKNYSTYCLAICASILLISLFTVAQYQRYFNTWAENPETKNAFSYHCVAIGNYLNSLPDNAEKYVIINEPGPNLPLPIETIIFIQHTKEKTENTYYIFRDQIRSIEKKDKPMSIVLMAQDEELFKELQIILPGGLAIKQENVWRYEIR